MRRGECEEEEEEEARRFLTTWDVDWLDVYVMTPVIFVNKEHGRKKSTRSTCYSDVEVWKMGQEIWSELGCVGEAVDMDLQQKDEVTAQRRYTERTGYSLGTSSFNILSVSLSASRVWMVRGLFNFTASLSWRRKTDCWRSRGDKS